MRRLHHRRRHLGGHARAEALRAPPRHLDHGGRGRQEALRPRKPHAVPPAQHRLRRESVARRLHRRPGRQGHHLAHHGGRRLRAALGRHVQSLLRRGSAPEIDVRPLRRLADRVEGAREVLLRGRAPPRRLRRAEPAARRLALRALPHGRHGDDPQSQRAEDVGRRSGIPFWSTPQAKNTKPYDGRAQCIRCNTCSICPTGARYSPDFTSSSCSPARTSRCTTRRWSAN